MKILLIIITLINICHAAPLKEIKVKEIEGIVSRFNWVKETEVVENEEGRQVRGTTPNRYYISMKVDKIDEKLRKSLNLYACLSLISPRWWYSEDLGKDEILLVLPSKEIEGIQSGKKLHIKNYSISADDGGCVASFDSIKIVEMKK